MSENYRNPGGMTDLERQMASPLGRPSTFEADQLRACLSAVEAQRDDLARQLEAAREGLVLADAALRGANMNMAVVERKVGAALKGE